MVTRRVQKMDCFARDGLGIARHSIVVDALTTASVLGVTCGIAALRGRK